MTQASLLRCLLKTARQSPKCVSFSQTRFCSAQVLHSHSLTVPSFGGSVWIKSPFKVHVQPTNTMDYPNLDKAFVKVLSSSQSSDNVGVAIFQNGHKLSVTGEVNNDTVPDKHTTLHVEVPIVYDVNVVTEGEHGDIACRDMIESHYCHLSSQEGDITVTSVKTGNLIIQSETGDIQCSGAIQGSVSIVSGDGDVVADKRFLGPSLDMSTDTGDIIVSSCYSDQSKFSTQTGTLQLRNVHNESYVAVYGEGDVTMAGVDGSTNVFIKKGNLDIQISHVSNESRVHVEEGDVDLKVADNHPVKLCVTGKQVVTDTKFGEYGAVETKEDCYQHYYGTVQPDQFSSMCQVMADSGRVSLSAQGWAQSIGFKIPK